MAIEAKQLERAFRYNSVDLPDPGPTFTIEQVRDMYSGTYPDITTAAIEGPEEKTGKLVYTFRRAVGTKGSDDMQVRIVQVGARFKVEERKQFLFIAWWSEWGWQSLGDYWITEWHDSIEAAREAISKARAARALPQHKVVEVIGQ